MKGKFYINKKLFLACAFVICCNSLLAQENTLAVRNTVAQLFVAMKTADTTLMKQTFTTTAILQTISERDGINVRDEKIADFITSIGKLSKADADERLGELVILIDGKLASVWAPYQFYYKGIFSHCGVNSLQLVQMDGQWKIQYIIDTRRKEACL